MKRVLLAVVAAIGAVLVAGAAFAETLDFNYFIQDSFGISVDTNWTQSNTPVPLSYVSGFSTTVHATGFDTVYEDGTPIVSQTIDYVTFYNATFSGGFLDNNGYGDNFLEPVLFTGPDSAPVFAPGIYDLRFGVLTVQVLAAVPETSTWALMISGIGLVGGALRLGRRRDGLSATAVKKDLLRNQRFASGARP